jgi:hypothetical protein
VRTATTASRVLSEEENAAQTTKRVARRWDWYAVPRSWRETAQVSLLLLALLAIFFWRAVFLGRKLVPMDLAYTDPFYLPYAPQGFTQPHNALLYDQAYQFYPGRAFTLEALRQGFLPFWNPYIYCGTPYLAEEEPAIFYPLNVLSYVFPAADTFLFTAVARLFVAGLATYWFVRTMGGGRFGALLSTISFTFCGFMVVWLSHQHTNVAAWLPAMFLTVEWLYRYSPVGSSPPGANGVPPLGGRKSSARHIVFVALVITMSLHVGCSRAVLSLSCGIHLVE